MKSFKESIISKKIAVIGAGRSGLAAVKLLKKIGARHIFLSERGVLGESTKVFLMKNRIQWEEGGHTSRIFDADLVILSPGVNVHNPFISRLKEISIPIFGELELGYRFIDGKIVAVTGTNGKSTVVSLIADMLKDYIPTGNIGAPLSNFAGTKKNFVLEVSSFQLMSIQSFRPDIAVVLNIDQDHLDWHLTLEEYISAKKRIFKNQRPEDILILNLDDPITRSFVEGARPRVFYFSLKAKTNAYVDDDMLKLNIDGKVYPLVKVSELKLVGVHNLYNALASSLTAFLAGAELDDIRKTLLEFSGLPHRIEFVREIRGVKFFNDSKATNPHAVRWALKSFDRNVILILGGKEKHLDYSTLIDDVREKVKSLIIFGENAPSLEKAFSGIVPLYRVNSLKEVVDKALELAESGDIVLFSPGTSSFDMFKNYKERGEKFKDEVRRINL